MTRQEFDSRFAATQQNTEGYTDAQLAAINNRVFTEVAGQDGESVEKSYIDHLFEHAFCACDVGRL